MLLVLILNILGIGVGVKCVLVMGGRGAKNGCMSLRMAQPKPEIAGMAAQVITREMLQQNSTTSHCCRMNHRCLNSQLVKIVNWSKNPCVMYMRRGMYQS